MNGHISEDTSSYLKTFGDAINNFHPEMHKEDILNAWTIMYDWYRAKDYEELGKSLADLCWLLEEPDNNHLETILDHDRIAAAQEEEQMADPEHSNYHPPIYHND